MRIERKIVIPFLFFAKFGFAQQNFVKNSSFEDTVSCPSYQGNFDKCLDWYNPSANTPDFFHICSAFDAGVPNNFWGYQMPKTGIAYAGFLTYNPSNGRDFVEGELISTLSSNKKYIFRFWISKSNTLHAEIDSIGVYFSDTLYSELTNLQTLNVIPQIKIPVSWNSDTTSDGWREIKAVFNAQGFENYFIIGNFDDNANTTLDTIGPDKPNTPGCYYYIDDVSIEEWIESDLVIEIPNVFTPNDDGVNDYFSFTTNEPVEFKATIFNRWGQVIKYNEESAIIGENKIWDGKNKNNEQMPFGVYYYSIEFNTGTENKTFNGFITIIR
ncbi:MAG: gliding motility-associated C-terminal domain-containing protein [Bacteroidota bacterium]